MGGNILGGDFPGGFSRGSLMGGNLSGGSFPDTVNHALFEIQLSFHVWGS